MKCPECGKRMFKDNRYWKCSNCGYIFISDINSRDMISKSNNSRGNRFGKLMGNVGNIKEQVSVQVKKEEAYIKSRLDEDSTALLDDNEFFISKTVLDGVDYITNKKQEFERERSSKKQNKNTASVKVDDNINQETEKLKKDISTKQKTDEPNYSNLELSDLQETLINTLPIIDNPSEYEEEIIKKYSEYNSEERKELLKDCWTITKLAEKHNIKRQEVEKAILSDEFLNKDLIGVFKVNPNNIRSLKILYRKPLTETSTKTTIQETKESNKETSTETTQNNKSDKKTKIQGTTRELFTKRSPEEKVKWGEEKVKKEAENRPENALFYIDGREGTIAIFDEYIQLDFTGSVLKKYLSRMGGVKKIYYPQINSIQKRDAGKYIMGSIEFEVPGMGYSGRGGGKSENIIHYDYYYQDEANRIYEFVNQKILNIQKNMTNPQSNTSDESSALSELKKAKELLDMGAITQEEFDNIKKELL